MRTRKESRRQREREYRKRQHCPRQNPKEKEGKRLQRLLADKLFGLQESTERGVGKRKGVEELTEQSFYLKVQYPRGCNTFNEHRPEDSSFLIGFSPRERRWHELSNGTAPAPKRRSAQNLTEKNKTENLVGARRITWGR